MYVIAGVTGNTGKVVAETLLAKGEKVRVIVRDAAKGAAFAARGAEVAVAELNDVNALTAALQGAKGAYLLVPPNTNTPDFRAYQATMGRAIRDAVKAAGVPHVVFLSSIGADKDSKTGPIVGLHGVEKELASISGTKTQFLRAAYFMENIGGSLGALGQGVLPSFFPKDFAFPMVATKDIGTTAAELLLAGADKTEVVNLGSSPISMSDVAQSLSALTGKQITVAEAPVTAMATTLMGYGVPREAAEFYQEMTESILSGHIVWEQGHKQIISSNKVADVLKGLLPS